MNINIGLLSDLHLENSNMDTVVNPGWDVLILNGDISTDLNVLDNFLQYKLPRDIPILYIPGNHEFEGRLFQEVDSLYQEVLQYHPHVQWLHNDIVDIYGLRFIGSPLWSNFMSHGTYEHDKKYFAHHVADFKHIYYMKDNKKPLLTADDVECEFNKAYLFLKDSISNTDKPVIVATHFAPLNTSIHPRYGDTSSSYWVNHLPELFTSPWIKAICHGHTHHSVQNVFQQIPVMCNPRGVSKQFNMSGNLAFDRAFTFSVDNTLSSSLPFTTTM